MNIFLVEILKILVTNKFITIPWTIVSVENVKQFWPVVDLHRSYHPLMRRGLLIFINTAIITQYIPHILYTNVALQSIHFQFKVRLLGDKIFLKCVPT